MTEDFVTIPIKMNPSVEKYQNKTKTVNDRIPKK